MKNHLTIAALFAVTGCQAPKSQIGDSPAVDSNVTGSVFSDLFGKRCSLEILFGSYAMGIDGKSHGEIKTLMARKSSELSIQERQWGREGEQAICIDMKNAANADRLEKEVTAIIAANEPTKGPVTVTRGPLVN